MAPELIPALVEAGARDHPLLVWEAENRAIRRKIMILRRRPEAARRLDELYAAIEESRECAASST